MSFTKTISTIAALSSIFGVGVAGFKLAENASNNPPSALEEKITQLEKQLEEATKSPPVVEVQPSAPQLPAAQPIVAPPAPVLAAPVVAPAPAGPEIPAGQ
jgi:hypothetical protein